jgi:putative ABC transport system permease protein
MDTLRQDFAYALRSLLQRPTFAITAVLTLALGIGASTAIFSVVNAVLLRPLPYADASRLVLVWGELRARQLKDFPFSPGDYRDLQEQTPAFAEMAAITPGRAPLVGDGGQPEQVSFIGATPNLFRMLGARVALGRDFTAEDATPQAPPPQRPAGAPADPNAAPPPPPIPTSVILAHDFWQRRYGGDPNVIGKTIDVGGNRGLVVGVLAPGFELLFPPNASIDVHPDLFGALRIDYENASRINVFLRVIGRLKPGISVATAQEQAERVATALREKYPISKTAGLHFNVLPMHEDLVADVRPTIVALMGAVVLVLLIACANVANLLLVRAASRSRELAVRAVLGSSPWRLVRQMLAESLVLAGAAAALGVALAWGGMKVLAAFAPDNLPRLDDVRLDPLVLAFAIGAALLSVALFAVVPALRASRPDVGQALRAGGRAPGLAAGKLLRNGVVVAEVALSFVLLVGGGLMLRSFVALLESDPGYDPRGVLTFVVGPQEQQPEARANFMRTFAARVRALPGVTAVTAASPFPLDGEIANARWGREDAVGDPSKFQQANVHIVLPGYFEAMRTRLIGGRTFTETDNLPDSKAIIIDERLAAKAFPNESPVGKRLLVRVRSPEPEWLDIVGVVARQRHESLVSEGREAIFLPDALLGSGAAGTWAVRTSGDPGALTPAIRGILREMDARLPLADVQPMQALVDRARAPTRFVLILSTIFAAVAAILAAVGLYGVLATAVRQRTAEIGVRIAIGAPTRSVFGLVLGEGLRLSLAGVVIGALGALLLTRVMRSLLFGVGPADPATYALAVPLFLVIAVAACWVPARRAAGLPPIEALRGSE